MINEPIFDMKHLRKLYFVAFIFLFSACAEDTNLINIRLGEIRATFVDAAGRSETLNFATETNVSPQDGYGYTASLKYLSIFRRMSSSNSTLHIRATNFDLATAATPITLISNSRLTFNLFPNNEIYEGKNGAITLVINTKNEDILEGTFSGSISNQSNPNDVYTVKNGQFKIRIQRF